MPFRVLALALAVVVLVTFATPAKAEAIEPFTIIAIAGAAVIVIVLIVYLVVANVEGPKMSKAPAFELPGPLVMQEPTPAPVVLVSVDTPREGP
jgi:hypothetical protein